MATYPVNKLRNVCVMGHGGDGKTSLVESLLFTAGATERVGKVLHLPAGWKIYALFSVGVPAEEAHREKKRLEEVVSYNGF